MGLLQVLRPGEADYAEGAFCGWAGDIRKKALKKFSAFAPHLGLEPRTP